MPPASRLLTPVGIRSYHCTLHSFWCLVLNALNVKSNFNTTSPLFLLSNKMYKRFWILLKRPVMVILYVKNLYSVPANVYILTTDTNTTNTPHQFCLRTELGILVPPETALWRANRPHPTFVSERISWGFRQHSHLVFNSYNRKHRARCD